MEEHELKQLSDYVDKLEEKHDIESSRKDFTTWAMMDLIKIIRSLTQDESINKQLDKVWDDIQKNC